MTINKQTSNRSPTTDRSLSVAYIEICQRKILLRIGDGGRNPSISLFKSIVADGSSNSVGCTPITFSFQEFC
ncbi:hypothetical protein BLOT_009238 [Blomia tropicalis]|nr:hypothetical protein BLOT_009238 [Blomia tropicalis]